MTIIIIQIEYFLPRNYDAKKLKLGSIGLLAYDNQAITALQDVSGWMVDGGKVQFTAVSLLSYF